MQELKIKAGFASIDITPPLGIDMAGYFNKRAAKEILDPLYASALALSDGTKDIIVISCDLIGISKEYSDGIKADMLLKLGLSSENIIIHCTHTHTGPITGFGPIKEPDALENVFFGGVPDEKYIEELKQKLLEVAKSSLKEMKDSIVYIGYGKEESISFIRRYRMKDGSIQTNPRSYTEIIEPMGTIDPIVGVISFKYLDGSGELLLVSFALHADIIGKSSFSADYPGHMRKAIKEQLHNCEVIFIAGAAGDINHVDAMYPEKTGSGYYYSIKVGLTLAKEVLKTYQNLMPLIVKTDKEITILSSQYTISVPKRKYCAQDLEYAKTLIDKFSKGTWECKGMVDAGELSFSCRSMQLSKMGEHINVEIQAITIGNLSFLALPGEVFVDIGRKIKNKSLCKDIFICTNSNGYMGYFPSLIAFSEGGYEVKSTMFSKELEDLIVDASVGLLEGCL